MSTVGRVEILVLPVFIFRCSSPPHNPVWGFNLFNLYLCVFHNTDILYLSTDEVMLLFIVTERTRTRERKWDGVGVMKDKEMKLEEVKGPHTLGWANILLCRQMSDILQSNGHSGTGTSPGVWFRNKPTDLSACVSEEREHEGDVVVKLNSEKRVSTGYVRAEVRSLFIMNRQSES